MEELGAMPSQGESRNNIPFFHGYRHTQTNVYPITMTVIDESMEVPEEISRFLMLYIYLGGLN